MTTAVIPNAEKIVGAYLREHEDIVALDANVAGRTPRSIAGPWIRLTQLDARNDTGSRAEHLISYFLQVDCFAGEGAMEAFTGQATANQLAATARAVLDGMVEADLDDVVVTDVRFTGMPRLPDESFEPAMERVVLDATVRMHAKP